MNPRHVVVALAGAWLALVACGYAGWWRGGLVLALVCLAALASLSVTPTRERSVLWGVVAPWLAVWGIALFGAATGWSPDGSVLGLRPSFAFIVLGYWLAGTAVLSLAFVWQRKRWLSAADWEHFKDEVAREADR